jgi:outer membrane biosynthesis protein TonB
MALPRLAAMKSHTTPLLGALVLAGVLISTPALAQFQTTPSVAGALKQPSAAKTEREYRKDGARHLYAAYGKQIHKGKMPPMLYGVAIIETEIGAGGEVRGVRIVRQPAAAEVGPWAVEMIKKASPFPAPAALGTVKYTEVWLVDKTGRFQLDSLTEGQR